MDPPVPAPARMVPFTVEVVNVAGGVAPRTAQPVFVYEAVMPGEIPTSPTTAPPVQVTAVPPRTAKLAADPSDWADADETPPSSAAVASRHPARYLFRLIMICI